jgi:hypothetical protein
VRDVGHVALATLRLLAEQNREFAPAAGIDFTSLQGLDPRPWAMAFAGKGGMTAELRFTSNVPSFVAAATIEAPGTALLQLNTDFPHPQLGDGVLMRLTLPVTATPEHTNLLNLLEAKDGADNAGQLGGWCLDANSPVFVTFVPTCLLEWDWLTSFVYDNAIRTQWAKALLVAPVGT